MKYLRPFVGRRLMVQLEHQGATLDGTLDAVDAEHIELVGVTVHTSADARREADGRFIVGALSIVWIQLP